MFGFILLSILFDFGTSGLRDFGAWLSRSPVVSQSRVIYWITIFWTFVSLFLVKQSMQTPLTLLGRLTVFCVSVSSVA